MTTQEWLRGAVGFTLTDLNIETIFLTRGVSLDADASTMSEQEQDLCRADAYVIYLTSSNKGAYKIQDGDSSESIGSESFTYRKDIQRLAMILYEKWGEEMPFELSDTIKSGTNLW